MKTVFNVGMKGFDPESAAALVNALTDFNIELVAGAAADTDIAVAGIVAGDTIIQAFSHPTAGGAFVLRTVEATSDGNVQATADTTGEQIIIFWRTAPE